MYSFLQPMLLPLRSKRSPEHCVPSHPQSMFSKCHSFTPTKQQAKIQFLHFNLYVIRDKAERQTNGRKNFLKLILSYGRLEVLILKTEKAKSFKMLVTYHTTHYTVSKRWGPRLYLSSLCETWGFDDDEDQSRGVLCYDTAQCDVVGYQCFGGNVCLHFHSEA